jgi:secreted trypsin-like serine protease
MRLRHLVILASCGLLVAAAPSQAIVGGEGDTAHPYVGLVASGGSACSGTLVSPTVFLTAAHCIQDPSSVRVRFGAAVSRETPFTEGTAYVHPGFCVLCGPGFAENDLAVVVLDSPVDMPRYGSLPILNAADALGHKSDVTLVGYGVSFFVGRQPVSTFQRLTADADAVDAQKLSGSFLKLKSKRDGAACFGDSGGPTFLPGTDTILGVTSYSATSRCTASSYSYRLDTEAARGFLSGFVSLP